MSHLLNVSRLQSKALRQPGNMPLMVEYTVPEETAPYLVSSSSSVMWISEAHPGPLVKAAVREGTLGSFFREVIDAVAAMGRQQNWGNVHPLTYQGLEAAINHLSFYDLDPLELLIPRAHPPGSGTRSTEDEDDFDGEVPIGAPEAPQRVSQVALMPPELRSLIEEAGLPFRPSAWVPDGTIIVVPKDRSFVGLVHQVTAKKVVGVVHNAARGIAIVQGVARNELADRPLPEADAG